MRVLFYRQLNHFCSDAMASLTFRSRVHATLKYTKKRYSIRWIEKSLVFIVVRMTESKYGSSMLLLLVYKNDFSYEI